MVGVVVACVASDASAALVVVDSACPSASAGRAPLDADGIAASAVGRRSPVPGMCRLGFHPQAYLHVHRTLVLLSLN